MANVSASKIATCIVIPRDLKDEIKAHTEKTGIPMNFIVSKAVRRYLEDENSTKVKEVSAK